MLILHLSDIHFKKTEVGSTQDPNFHLRNELLRDMVRQCERLGPPDAIVVSGDLAFAGDPAEFHYATEWLQNVCDQIGAEMKSIFVCPGNHDVVRSTADTDLVQLLHAEIKRQEGTNVNGYIASRLRDPATARLLYESLDNYNDFALQFFCDLLPPERTLTKREVLLNDGSVLRLWGLNTTFVSSSADQEGDLFVDPASFQITRERGVVNLVAAHHYLSWIRQKRVLEDHLNDVAHIQMFGHVHTNRIVREAEYIRLTASAAHPDRHEADWEPGYNLIELSVDGYGSDRRLCIRAHVRVWQTAPGGFRVKMNRDSDVFDHSIPLESWLAPETVIVETDTDSDDDGAEAACEGMLSDGGRIMNELRDVGLQFYQLSFSKKSEIAGRLNLLEDEDMSQPDFERFRRVFIRAHKRGKLDELIEAVRAAEGG